MVCRDSVEYRERCQATTRRPGGRGGVAATETACRGDETDRVKPLLHCLRNFSAAAGETSAARPGSSASTAAANHDVLPAAMIGTIAGRCGWPHVVPVADCEIVGTVRATVAADPEATASTAETAAWLHLVPQVSCWSIDAPHCAAVPACQEAIGPSFG